MTTAWRAAIIAVLTVALGVGIPAAAQAIDVTVGVRIAGSVVAAVLLLVLVRRIASDRADSHCAAWIWTAVKLRRGYSVPSSSLSCATAAPTKRHDTRTRSSPRSSCSSFTGSRRCDSAAFAPRHRRARRCDPHRDRTGSRRKACGPRTRARRVAGRRPRAARGLSGAGPDADRSVVRANHGARLRARAVHARPHARRHHGYLELRST